MEGVGKSACPICGRGLGCSCQLKRENGIVVGCDKCYVNKQPQSPNNKQSVRSVAQAWWKKTT